MFEESLFPDLPEKKGLTAPVFLSPIIGSGERICIAAVSIIENTFEVRRAFPKSDINALSRLNKMIDVTIAEVEHHLSAGNGHNLGTFCPGVLGVTLGVVEPGLFSDHQMALRTVFRNHSMFHTE